MRKVHTAMAAAFAARVPYLHMGAHSVASSQHGPTEYVLFGNMGNAVAQNNGHGSIRIRTLSDCTHGVTSATTAAVLKALVQLAAPGWRLTGPRHALVLETLDGQHRQPLESRAWASTYLGHATLAPVLGGTP